MDEYNGISLIPQLQWSQPDAIFSTDSCLSGCGGILNIHQRYFHSIFPNFILDMKLDINSLELLAMVVALKLWGSLLRGYRVQVYCDNAASVAVVNSGRSRCEFLNSCLREIAYLCATYEIQIHCLHICGSDNRVSDYLSRWHLEDSYSSKFFDLCGQNMTCSNVQPDMFCFTADW